MDWRPWSGALLFSHSGDYSRTATTGPAFNGQFVAWFNDGSRFITSAGGTRLIYSLDGTQQGSIASVSDSATTGGAGNFVWTYPNTGAVLNIYPTTGSNPAVAASYTLSALATVVPSGTALGIATLQSSTVSYVDLSGATPVKTDYTSPVGLTQASDVDVGSFASLSASEWVIGNASGVLVDGASLSSTPKFFGYGRALSVVGGTSYFAIATASGQVVYFDSNTLAPLGQLPILASKLLASTDGTVLIAMSDIQVQVYSLPSGNLQYAWPYTSSVNTGGTVVQDIALSGSGTIRGQTLFAGSNSSPTYYSQSWGLPNGGAFVFSRTFNSSVLVGTPPMRISPDGTLVAVSQQGSPTLTQFPDSQSSLGAGTL
jgi:hypothetical protein